MLSNGLRHQAKFIAQEVVRVGVDFGSVRHQNGMFQSSLKKSLRIFEATGFPKLVNAAHGSIEPDVSRIDPVRPRGRQLRLWRQLDFAEALSGFQMGNCPVFRWEIALESTPK